MKWDSISHRQYHRLSWAVGLGLVVATLVLYFSTLAPTVLEADAGEFQFVAWLPSIAHPTGYPLYILLGWLWTHLLPIGEVAWRMNLLSAVFAAMAIGAAYAVSRRLLDRIFPEVPKPARIIAAVVAAATFALTPTFWSQALVAEVYALHMLLVAAIFWLGLRFRSPDDSINADHWSGKLLAFTLGLGLAHHLTTVLLLPGLALFLWLTRPVQNRTGSIVAVDKRTTAKRLLGYCALFLAPLLLYLYLPLAAPLTPYVRLAVSNSQTITLYDNSLAGFLNHVTGTVFSGQLQPAALGLERFSLTEDLLRQQVGLVGVTLALIGILTVWWRRQIALLLLTGVSFLTFVGFNLVYFIGDVFVLFIPAWFIVCLWLGIGCLALANGLAKAFVQRKIDNDQPVVFERMQERLGQNVYRLLVVGLTIFFLALPVTFLATRMSAINQRNNRAASTMWQEILSNPIPTSSILLSNDRNEIMPMWYYQLVEGRRPDLLGLFPLIVPGSAYANIGRVLDQALASGRPVYLIKSMDGLSLKADLVPEGTLVRARAYAGLPGNLAKVTLPPITAHTSGRDLQETITILGFDVSPASAAPGDEVTVTVYWQPTQNLVMDYTSYVHLLTEHGTGIAQSDHLPGGVFYPSSLWQTGEILRDEHRLSIPADAQAGKYRLRIGMYYQPEPGVISGMGNGVEMGMLAITEPVSIDESPSPLE